MKIKVNPEVVVRERRKLKKFYYLEQQGRITYKEIENQYKSWKNNYKKYIPYYTLKQMDGLYDKLFIWKWLSKNFC